MKQFLQKMRMQINPNGLQYVSKHLQFLLANPGIPQSWILAQTLSWHLLILYWYPKVVGLFLWNRTDNPAAFPSMPETLSLFCLLEYRRVGQKLSSMLRNLFFPRLKDKNKKNYPNVWKIRCYEVPNNRTGTVVLPRIFSIGMEVNLLGMIIDFSGL